eukprot:403341269
MNPQNQDQGSSMNMQNGSNQTASTFGQNNRNSMLGQSNQAQAPFNHNNQSSSNQNQQVPPFGFGQQQTANQHQANQSPSMFQPPQVQQPNQFQHSYPQQNQHDQQQPFQPQSQFQFGNMLYCTTMQGFSVQTINIYNCCSNFAVNHGNDFNHRSNHNHQSNANQHAFTQNQGIPVNNMSSNQSGLNQNSSTQNQQRNFNSQQNQNHGINYTHSLQTFGSSGTNGRVGRCDSDDDNHRQHMDFLPEGFSKQDYEDLLNKVSQLESDNYDLTQQNEILIQKQLSTTEKVLEHAFVDTYETSQKNVGIVEKKDGNVISNNPKLTCKCRKYLAHKQVFEKFKDGLDASDQQLYNTGSQENLLQLPNYELFDRKDCHEGCYVKTLMDNMLKFNTGKENHQPSNSQLNSDANRRHTL